MICSDCKKGKHEHLKDIENKKKESRDKAEFLDSIDCKNIIDKNNQCICPEFTKHIMKPFKKR